MYDVKQLEDEWKQYRKKKLRPWYIGILILLSISVPIVLFLVNEKIDFTVLKTYFKSSKDAFIDQEIPSSKKMKTHRSVLVNDALDRLEIKKDMIEVVDKVVKTPVNILVDIPLLDDQDQSSVIETQHEKPKMHLDIIETSNVTAYKDVEKRFLQSREIDDALFLARSYYKKGDYKKAEYWALETNKLDENSEESLFIFVKSKARSGHRNEAITILTTYIKESNSQEGKKLLYQIENNKL
jgi:tetratricopeptide (TPR) repeat protein